MTAQHELNKGDTNEHSKCGWGKSHKDSTLQEELQTTEESQERERWSFPVKNTPTDCLVPHSQP